MSARPLSLCAVLLGLCLAQLRLPQSSTQALNETLAPHLKNKIACHKDRQLPAQSYHAQINQTGLSLSFSLARSLPLSLFHSHLSLTHYQTLPVCCHC